MTRTSPDLTQAQFPHSPFLEPDWRWQSALQMFRSGARPRRNEDQYVLTALRFLEACSSANTPAKEDAISRRWPELARACTIHFDSSDVRHEIEARLLCEPVALIGEKTGVTVEAVVTFARVFYDVIDIEPITDWLIYTAANVGQWFRRPPIEAEIWKYMAIIGGPIILDLLIQDSRSQASQETQLLAQKARFCAMDFATQLRKGPIMDRQMLAELERLFGDSLRQREREDPGFAPHTRFLQMLARTTELKSVAGTVPTAPQGKPRHDKSRRKATVAGDVAVPTPVIQQSDPPIPGSANPGAVAKAAPNQEPQVA